MEAKGRLSGKQEAARLQKAALVVIGRPTQEEGYSVEEAWNLVLESLYAKGRHCGMRKLTVVGMGTRQPVLPDIGSLGSVTQSRPDCRGRTSA